MLADWSEVQLGEVADLLTGYPFKSQHYTQDDADPRLVGGDNIAQGALRWDSVRRWPRAMSDGLDPYWLAPGDVVLAMDRPWIEAGLKRAAICAYDLPALLVQRTARLRGTPRLDVRFLRYLIGSREFTQYILNIQTGTAIPHISPTQIRAFRFVLPPLSIQASIAHILGALDDKIKLHRRMNETLEEMARALFKSWFVDFDPVHAKAAGKRPYRMDEATAALFPAEFGDSSQCLPLGWRLADLGSAVDLIIDHRGKTPAKLGGVWSDAGIPALSAKNIKNGDIVRRDAIRFVDEALFARWMPNQLRRGDVLMTSEAPLGELYYMTNGVRYCLSQRLFAIRGKMELLLGSYLYLYLDTKDVRADLIGRATGTTVLGIRQSELRAVRLVLAPIALQRAFAAVIEPILSLIDSNREQSSTLATLRDALLPKLLSGELRVDKAEKVVAEAV